MSSIVELATCPEPQVSHLGNGDSMSCMKVGKISNDNNVYYFFNA